MVDDTQSGGGEIIITWPNRALNNRPKIASIGNVPKLALLGGVPKVASVSGKPKIALAADIDG